MKYVIDICPYVSTRLFLFSAKTYLSVASTSPIGNCIKCYQFCVSKTRTHKGQSKWYSWNGKHCSAIRLRCPINYWRVKRIDSNVIWILCITMQWKLQADVWSFTNAMICYSCGCGCVVEVWSCEISLCYRCFTTKQLNTLNVWMCMILKQTKRENARSSHWIPNYS